nr:MAG TPA: hypothetical protein [Caudoviricetes sp.]
MIVLYVLIYIMKNENYSFSRIECICRLFVSSPCM